MIPKSLIVSLEQQCSQLQCPDCGKLHRVTLRNVGMVVSPHFEDSTCDGFKVLVHNFVRTKLTRWINDPFPYLR